MLFNSKRPFVPDEAALLRYEEMMAGNTVPVYIGPEHYRTFLSLEPAAFENLIFAVTRAQGKALALAFHESRVKGGPDHFPELVSNTLFIFATGVAWFDDFGRLCFRRRYGPRPSCEIYLQIARRIADAGRVIQKAVTTFTSEVLAETKTSTKKVKVICSFEDSAPQAFVKRATRARRFLN